MTRAELLQTHTFICDRASGIMRAKNEDYTGGTDDPFANFRTSEHLLGIDARLGILLRVADKLQRIRSFIAEGKLAVRTEPVDDAILDIINYMVLLQGLINEARHHE